MTIAADGKLAMVVSDLAWIWSFTIGHDEAGRLGNIVTASGTALLDETGRPLTVDEERNDAEAIVPDAGGGYLIAFGRQHRGRRELRAIEIARPRWRALHRAGDAERGARAVAIAASAFATLCAPGTGSSKDSK